MPWSPPTHCRAAVFERPNNPLVLRDFEVPAPFAGEALVRVELCTVCGSDIHTLTGARTEPTPTILGHEIVGRIVATGSPPPNEIGGKTLQLGDRVTWSVCVSCFQCDRCKDGFPQKCRRLFKYGHSIAEGRCALSGGLAEYVLLRTNTSIVKLPSDLPLEVVCPVSCATSTVAHAFRLGAPVRKRSVLILGAGMLGITAVAFGRWLGADQIVVADINASRLRNAASFGADRCVDLSAADQGFESPFDLVLECSGAAAAVQQACELATIGGRVILVGSVMDSEPVRLDPTSIVRRCLTISGAHNYAPSDLRQAVEFLVSQHQQYPFGKLIEKRFPMSEINEALEQATVERPIRLAIEPS